jgi:hypothetical protein
MTNVNRYKRLFSEEKAIIQEGVGMLVRTKGEDNVE